MFGFLRCRVPARISQVCGVSVCVVLVAMAHHGSWDILPDLGASMLQRDLEFFCFYYCAT